MVELPAIDLNEIFASGNVLPVPQWPIGKTTILPRVKRAFQPPPKRGRSISTVYN